MIKIIDQNKPHNDLSLPLAKKIDIVDDSSLIENSSV